MHRIVDKARRLLPLHEVLGTPKRPPVQPNIRVDREPAISTRPSARPNPPLPAKVLDLARHLYLLEKGEEARDAHGRLLPACMCAVSPRLLLVKSMQVKSSHDVAKRCNVQSQTSSQSRRALLHATLRNAPTATRDDDGRTISSLSCLHSSYYTHPSVMSLPHVSDGEQRGCDRGAAAELVVPTMRCRRG